MSGTYFICFYNIIIFDNFDLRLLPESGDHNIFVFNEGNILGFFNHKTERSKILKDLLKKNISLKIDHLFNICVNINLVDLSPVKGRDFHH